jgi:hypothetical protein
LLISFGIFGWWRPLNAFTLGLFGATLSSCTWLVAYIPLDGLPHLVDMTLTCSRVGSHCPRIPSDSEEAKEAAS